MMNEKQVEAALKLALEAFEADASNENFLVLKHCVREALADSALERMAENARELGLDYEPPCKTGSQCTSKCQQCEQPAKEQKPEFVSPGGGYVPAIPRPIPLDWKLVPRKATPEMLKAMDECAQEGYDERLYEGMASSVYMAAWDASPVMGTLPEQPAPVAKPHEQQEPVAVVSGYYGGQCVVLPTNPAMLFNSGTAFYTSPPASKPLTDEQRKAIVVCFTSGKVSVSEVQRKLAISYNEAQQLCQSIVDLKLAQGLQLAPSLDRHGIKGDA